MTKVFIHFKAGSHKNGPIFSFYVAAVEHTVEYQEHTVEYQDPNTEIHGTAHYVKYKRSFPDATEGD